MIARILYLQFTNPGGYPPLDHSSRMFAEAGCTVRFLGTEAFSGTELVFPPHPRIAVHLWRFRGGGLIQKLQFVAFVIRCVLWAVLWRPRVVYASDPMATPAAWLVSFLPWCRVIYHEHDSPASQPTTGFQKWILKFRRAAARRMFLNILPNATRAERFREATGTQRPVEVVWNCPARSDAEPIPVKNKRITLFYHGSIVPARVPLSVIEALALLPDDCDLVIAGYETIGSTGYQETLRQKAADLGIASRVRFLGTIPLRSDLLKECRRAHLGLCLMPMHSEDLNEQAMAGASNKPFDYLACGLRLLVSDLPEWREMFVDAGFAQVCDPRSPESIARAAAWFLDNPTEAAAENGGRQRILLEWNYERQFAPVLALLEGEAYAKRHER